MAFTNLKLTTFGQNLDAKCKLGKGLHLSRVVIGDGLLGNGSMVNRTALVSERYSMLVDAKQLTEAGAVAAIVSTLDNSDFTEGFPYRELGLMGVDPDTSQEGLYLYDNAGEECEFLDTRANGVVIYERLKLLIKTQDAASITFDPSGNPLYIGVDDPVSNNTVTFTQAAERTNIQSGETLAVLFGKAKKWFASLGSAAFTESSSYAARLHASSHAPGGSDPLTPAQIGADPSGSAAAVQANLAAHAGRTDNPHGVTRGQIGAAATTTLTATVPVAWTASGDFFYQNVSVPGMLASDNPVADILMGSDNAANKLYAEAWGKVLRATTYDGGVQIWCTEAPTVAFPVQFKVVR
ncbi:hypothetical protein [Oscillibacter sp.]|uniref:hypothetical protein n=1 Tax=Oscillibacter sp. TaxID=1945593 RepID=UPI0028AEFAAE|nr:hypothetical protein [Oscillibacter sp.]